MSAGRGKSDPSSKGRFDDVWLKGWIDDELDGERRAEVASRLRRDPESRATVEDYKRLSELLQAETHVPAPRTTDVLRRVREHEQQDRQLVCRLKVVSGFAATLLVAAVVAFFVRDPAVSRATSALTGADRALPHERATPLNEYAGYVYDDAMVVALISSSERVE